MALSSSKQWLHAIIMQGQRLLDMHKKSSKALESHLNMKIFHELLEEQRIEEYFFIIAVDKAGKWLKETSNLYPQFKAYSTEFDNKTPLAKEIRDMREHEIDYIKGKGWQQDKFISDVGLNPGEIAADATSTIISENEYLIGGRLNVQQAVNHSFEIYPAIVNFFEAEMFKG